MINSTSTLSVNWAKTVANTWPRLRLIDLSNVKIGGNYFIWAAGNIPRVIRVGQGDIAERLCDHRADPNILGYEYLGELLVTWAAVPQQFRDGVETYMASQYSPIVGDRFPKASPIVVNLP